MGVYKIIPMSGRVLMAIVVIAFDSFLLDGLAHPLDRAVGPRTVCFGRTVFNAIFIADTVKNMLAKICCNA